MSTVNPTKLNNSLSIPAPSINPFASLFQTLNQAPANHASSIPTAQKAVPVATPAVTPAVTPAATQPPGITSLIGAMMNGSFKATYVMDPAKLAEGTPFGAYTASNFYYASDETANQIAQLLGGKVVQQTPFGQSPGWSPPLANFIQLPNGQTFNAADIAYYGRCAGQGVKQLTADLTQTINMGSAFATFYQHGGPFPIFPVGYTGQAITGMTYPAGTIAPDGSVINPVMMNT